MHACMHLNPSYHLVFDPFETDSATPTRDINSTGEIETASPSHLELPWPEIIGGGIGFAILFVVMVILIILLCICTVKMKQRNPKSGSSQKQDKKGIYVHVSMLLCSTHCTCMCMCANIGMHGLI